MVSDADKRIAWGPMGGMATFGRDCLPSGGHQRIKHKQDLERWDQQTMKRVACWRHKLLAQEALSPAGPPGAQAFK